MAGEITSSTSWTSAKAGKVAQAAMARGTVHVCQDSYLFTSASQLEAGDTLILNMPIPSNAIILELRHMNGDLDTAGTTLVVDIGLAVREPFVSVTSGVTTKWNTVDAIIDSDLLIDGNTAFTSAVTEFTNFAAAATATWGITKRQSPMWQVLGYDKDPGTVFNLTFQSQAASGGLSSSATLAMVCYYTLT